MPETGYMLCASPRSGSTLLCDLLIRSGVAGVPESYFRPASIPGYAERWSVATARGDFGPAYVSAARQAGTGDSGSFGMRIMWSDVPAFLERLMTLDPDARDEPDALRRAFGISSYIHLGRRDLVAQAVSLVIASQSGLWHVNADGSERQRTQAHQEPAYDSAAIAAELEMLRREADGWAEWFSLHGIDPLRVEYEDLAANADRELSRVAAHLGVMLGSPLAVGTAKMATELNAAWSDRFRWETLGR